MTELFDLQANGEILLEGDPGQGKVSLDGWNPETASKENGNVAGVIVRFWGSGLKAHPESLSGGAAPDFLDPRNALALVRLCQWLHEDRGVTELYHAGISGDSSLQRTDCHGQGRAVDFVGVAGNDEDSGSFLLTVADDWGNVATPATPGGDWPAGTSQTAFRLDQGPDPFAADFFSALYDFVAGEWQDTTSAPDPETTHSSIGDGTFIMTPDHPTSAPGTPHGREAHKGHVHMQIGVTGTA
jgi:hypothetical protein